MDRSITEATLTWVENHPALAGYKVHYETLPAHESDVMLGTLSGSPKLAEYLDGSYIALYRFQIIMRINAGDTGSRLDAMDALTAICDSVDAGQMPASPAGFGIFELEVSSLPARMTTEDDGTEEYQVSFDLTYRKDG